MRWKIKAYIFRTLSVMPFGTHLHFQLQKHVTKEWPRSSSTLEQLLIAARRVYQTTEGHRQHFLEIGAGRDLAVAVALRLMGVERVTCVDVSRLAQPGLVDHAATYMAERLGVAVPKFHSWSDIERFGISYRAPTRLQNATLEPSSFDCFFSIDTLEHIPPEDLREVLMEVKCLLKPGGLSVHCIDYGDHYARSDNRLSRFNFLTYTERDWRPFNTRYQYVNRLRHSQYLKLFADVGMKLIRDEPDIAPPQQPILDHLAPQFREFDVPDLFTIRAMIVSFS
jgi:SAM-dependent methyltransferase